MGIKLKDMIVSDCNVRISKTNDEEILALMYSIEAHSLISRIVLRPSKDAGVFEIIAGQRRYKAFLEMHGPEYELSEEDFKVMEGLNDDEAFLISIQENQFRVDLSPLELNKAALKLNKLGKSDKEVAKTLNVTPYRLKRLYVLSQDKNKMPEEVLEELSKPVGNSKFTDAHWDKVRNLEDKDMIKDVVDFIIEKETPPREVPSVIKGVQKQYEASEGPGSSSYTPEDDKSPEDPGGPISYQHKGELTFVQNGDDVKFSVKGKDEDEAIPIDHYLEYLKHPEKFKCRVNLKLTFIPLD